MKFMIFLFMILLSVGFVNAATFCFPEVEEQMEQLCLDGWLTGDVNSEGSYYYCNIDDVVDCPLGCNFEENECLGSNPFPVCDEGARQCGDTFEYDPNGDLYDCLNGELVYLHGCGVGEECVEISYGYADCFNIKKDCWMPNKYTEKCEFQKDNFFDIECYDTQKECMASFPDYDFIMWVLIVMIVTYFVMVLGKK